ncbi:LacI family DNA-binding transcriptional regulator [Loktanella sp. SALINAS62]|uniref:LacI family DNA-binding transcriptional regulator n=1 Tax=Loktanella sp. SALINAS62 TaxID=2706124 RepID=UPI001B8D4DFC|nr:LacI family DNA-binding transcriptional regulator [Loktanella sp. SALINAS62]MBS1302957.1 LacI family DNA-binding transcriptional regulator [Loktanella sp. SALINAS62]
MRSNGAVSARDVAEAAGVSRTAVSRTFTPGASVAPATRAKVMAAAELLGYQVNNLARGLTRAESGLVALIVAELETPYRALLVSALTSKLQAAGKVAMIINTDRSDASVDAALRQAIGYRTDAAIVLSGMPDRALAELCQRNGLRLVLINRDEELPGAVRIRLDDEQAGATAARTLLRVGCKRPALVMSASATVSLAARARGFLDALSGEGIDPMVAIDGPTHYKTGLALGTDILSRADRPDGVFCVTDLIAFGVIDAARQRFGLRVPEDLSVIGFDDVPQASWEAYNLTTFRQPIPGIVDACVDWLSRPLDETSAKTVYLSADITWRTSVLSLSQRATSTTA